jgi:hypothetical protein
MTKPGSSLVAVVMDRSGSMEQVRDVTIAGINEFMVKQKAEPGECSVYYTQFDNEYEVVHRYVPIAFMPLITRETYVPRGNTALYDAIGRTVVQVGADLAALSENERPEHVVVVIQTDGYENASREYRLERIKALMKNQTDVYGWGFVFLGASVAAMEEGKRMGMHVNSMMSYAPHIGGQSVGAFRSTSAYMANVRSGAAPAADGFSEEDRQELVKTTEEAAQGVTSPPSE